MRDIKFEWYFDKQEKYRFRFKAGNGRVLAKSPKGYSDKELVDVCYEIVSQDADAEVYIAKDGWRWRYTKGSILVVSSESYKNEWDCIRASNLVLDSDLKQAL